MLHTPFGRAGVIGGALLMSGTLTARNDAQAQDAATEGGGAAAPAGTTAQTSWAASVRAALANRAHEAAARIRQDWSQHGLASWYGRHHRGRRTSSGEIFDTEAMTAAHPSLPLGTKLLVTSQETGRSVVVTVNDRGPFNHRVIDLSRAAAEKIGMIQAGTAHVTIARLEGAPGAEAPTEVAEAAPSDTSEQAIRAAAPAHATPVHKAARHTRKRR